MIVLSMTCGKETWGMRLQKKKTGFFLFIGRAISNRAKCHGNKCLLSMWEWDIHVLGSDKFGFRGDFGAAKRSSKCLNEANGLIGREDLVTSTLFGLTETFDRAGRTTLLCKIFFYCKREKKCLKKMAHSRLTTPSIF